MGLMTLISRKLNPEKYQPQSRAPPYERKVSAKSPVRLIQKVSPSASAANVFDSLNALKLPDGTDVRPEPYLSPASSRVSSSYDVDSVAPASGILGFRGDGIPNKSSTPRGECQTRQTDACQSNPPHLHPAPSPRPPSRLSQLMVSRARPTAVKAMMPEFATQSKKPPLHRAQSSIASSRFTKSVKTSGGDKGYVDILDAQSQFRPANFYDRVKASGARDYGEDVADRNIGANGCDLGSQPVQTFYSINQHRTLSMRSRPPHRNSAEENDNYYQQTRATRKASVGSALHAESLNSSHSAVYSHRPAASPKRRAMQRQALNTLSSVADRPYNPTSISGQEQHRLVDLKRKRRSLQISRNDVHRQIPAWETTSPISDDGFSDLDAISPPRLLRPVTSDGQQRTSSATSRRSGVTMSGLEHCDHVPEFGINNQPILSPQPRSFHLSASLGNSALTASRKHLSTMQSTDSVKQPRQLMLESHNTKQYPSDPPSHLEERVLDSRPEWQDDITERESAPSPFIKTARSRSQSRDDVGEHFSADRITTPVPPRLQAGDIESHTPGHTASSRHWSMTSTAPTTSSSSSVMYGRPQSRHTANTSIDLSTGGLSAALNPSLLSVNNENIGQLPLKVPDLESDAKESIFPKVTFSIDDHVSSDDDSILGDIERGESEEDLLFSTGYGEDGVQLPGLEDLFSAPAPTILMASPCPRIQSPSGELNSLQDVDKLPGLNQLVEQRAASDDGDNLIPDFNISRCRRFTGTFGPVQQKDGTREECAKRTETKRLAALSGPSAPGVPCPTILGRNSLRYHPHPNHHLHHGNNVGEQVIEEEKFEKVDIATAILLRKKAKSEKRASVVSMAKQRPARGLDKMAKTRSHDSSAASDADSFGVSPRKAKTT